MFGAANTGPVGDPAEFDLGENEFAGMVGININLLDAYVHSWDIAQATGQSHELDPAICAGLFGFARNIIPEAPREGDNFHPVVATGADAGGVADLLGYLGRRP